MEVDEREEGGKREKLRVMKEGRRWTYSAAAHVAVFVMFSGLRRLTVNEFRVEVVHAMETDRQTDRQEVRVCERARGGSEEVNI